MKVDIKAGVKIHNKFEVEVRNVETGEIEQKAEAYNIVLNQQLTALVNGYDGARSIAYGSGTGTISATRTTLFNQLGIKSVIEVETVWKQPPEVSYRKTKIVISTSEHIGAVFTEIGIIGSGSTLFTHALLKDSEGNTISIGPKTDIQEITIYATVYADITLPENTKLTYLGVRNELLFLLLGTTFVPSSYSLNRSQASDSAGSSDIYGMGLNLSSSKIATDDLNNRYESGDLGAVGSPFTVKDLANYKVSTPRLRFESGNGNGKIWSIAISTNIPSQYSITARRGFLRMLLPNSIFPGHNFINKAIGTGNGSQTKFILPWSDINTTKTYKFYKDGVLLVENTDYTLANSESETSITFTTAPADTLPITGDWWVDYIPKDTNHVLDITFSITYGEGA